MNFFTLVMILAVLVGSLLAHRFGPYYWDYWKMKEITKTTALHWKVYSRKAAEEKLVYMLSEKEFGDNYIGPDFCGFSETSKTRTVWCSWEVEVNYPFSDHIRTLSFATEHAARMDGR